MKIKNVRCYRSKRSALVVIALKPTAGIIIQEGEDFKLNQVCFDFSHLKMKLNG